MKPPRPARELAGRKPDPRAFLRVPLRTKEEAEAFIRALHAANLLFHFDDSPDDIVETRTGARTFTDDEVPHVRARVNELFALLADPFALAVDLTNEPDQQGDQK